MRLQLSPFEHIRRVHVEMTTRCNARCPSCPRNVRGGQKNPHLPLRELSLSDFRQIFQAPVLRQLSSLQFCGNYGDPAVARDLLPSLEYARRSNSDLEISIHTNGSVRTPAWWRIAAATVNRVVFAIDGLEDTNHLYRIGTLWSVIMENAAAAIAAGCRVEWQFIVFAHNEHQVESARGLAKRMGFARFVPKRSARFYHDGTRSDTITAVQGDGSISHRIQAPQNPTYSNPAGDALVHSLAEHQYDSFADYIARTPISCKTAARDEVYVDAGGFVFPCCYVAQLYPATANARAEEVRRLLENCGGLKTLDGRCDDLRHIAKSRFFMEITDSWDRSDRLTFCAAHCGTFDLIGAQPLSAD